MFTFAGLTSARMRLDKLARGLHQIAGGEVTRKAAEDVRAYVDKVAAENLAAHRKTGEAWSDMRVDVSGSAVELHGLPSANGRQWSGSSYVRLHGWWKFRRGMPGFVVKRAAQIYAAAVLAALGGRAGNLGALAGEVADEEAAAQGKAAAKARAKAERHAARVAKAEARFAAKRQKRSAALAKQHERLTARVAKADAARLARMEKRAARMERRSAKMKGAGGG
jgi:hypothetical protein